MFGFDDRTRELLRGIWLHGTISDAAARIGMDVGNAGRHLRTAARRAGVPLVQTRRGGRGGPNAQLSRAGQRFLDMPLQFGVALAFDPAEGVTPIRVGNRLLFAGGVVAPGPVEVSVQPASVALERPSRTRARSSIRNRFAARVDGVEPISDGVFRVALSSGSLRFASLVVRGAIRDLRLRPGSRVHATIKAVSIAAAVRSG